MNIMPVCLHHPRVLRFHLKVVVSSELSTPTLASQSLTKAQVSSIPTPVSPLKLTYINTVNTCLFLSAEPVSRMLHWWIGAFRLLTGDCVCSPPKERPEQSVRRGPPHSRGPPGCSYGIGNKSSSCAARLFNTLTTCHFFTRKEFRSNQPKPPACKCPAGH